MTPPVADLNSASTSSATRLRHWLASPAGLAATVLILAVIPYFNTLFNGFVYDDGTQVTNNPYLQSFRYLRQIFTTSVWSYVGLSRGTNYYRPMMTLGYLMCYQMFGPLAYGFHLANLILHTAAVSAVFLVFERIAKRAPAAILAAGLFAIHPIHTESVAWIAAVTDLEMTLFYLLAFWFFLGSSRSSGARRALLKTGMLACFLLALLSKEQALTLPLLCAVYEHFYRDDRALTTPSRKILRYAPLWLLAAAYVFFRIRFLGTFARVLHPDITWYEASLSALPLVGQYLWKLVWPLPFCAFYVFRKSMTWLDPRVIAAGAVLIVCLAAFVLLWRRARPASFGLVWFAVTLTPVLNARWLAGNVFTERYLYLPSVGFCWLVATGLVRLWDTKPAWRKHLAFSLAILTFLCVTLIVRRNRDWGDDLLLYTRTLALQPDAWQIRNNLGATYWSRGDVRSAEREWREVLKIYADNQIVLSNLGLVCSREKRYAEAIQYFQRALKIDPRLTDAHVHLGEAYLEMNQTALAEFEFRNAVELSPLNIQARNHLGKMELEAGRLAEAEEQFRRSVESQPNAAGYAGLGDIELKRGAFDRAERAFSHALTVDPFHSHAHFKLGEVYARAGRKAEALREFQAGFVTDPHNAEATAAVEKLGARLPNDRP